MTDTEYSFFKSILAALAGAIARFAVVVVYRKVTEIDISKLESCFLAIEEIHELLAEGDIDRVTVLVAKKRLRFIWKKKPRWVVSAIVQFKLRLSHEKKESYRDIVVDEHYCNIVNRLADDQVVFFESSEIKKGGNLLANIYTSIGVNYSEIHPIKSSMGGVFYMSFASSKKFFSRNTTREKIRVCKDKVKKVLD